jgi:hypothetical protein
MTGGKKYFDINITQWSYQDDNKSTHDISMQPCTYEQWNSYGDEFSQRYQSLGLAQWLCPVVNQTIDLQGKFSSRTFKLMKIGVSKCTGVIVPPMRRFKHTSPVTKHLRLCSITPRQC